MNIPSNKHAGRFCVAIGLLALVSSCASHQTAETTSFVEEISDWMVRKGLVAPEIREGLLRSFR